MPRDLKLEVAQFTCGEVVTAVQYLAHVAGQAQARQMDPARRAEWHNALIVGGTR